MEASFSIVELDLSVDFRLMIDLTQKLFSDLAGKEVAFSDDEIDKIISDMPPPGKLVFFTAVDGSGDYIGFVSLYESYSLFGRGNYGIINEMWVANHWRNNAVGTALLQQAVAYGRARGWTRIEVTTPPDSEKVKKFYEKTGFALTGHKLKLVS